MIKKEIVCKAEDKLLNVISQNNINYQSANKLLRKKDIKVDGARMSKNIQVYPGQVITIFIQEENLPKLFEKIFEDENLLIKEKYFPVNRLDRNTEGLTIFAKSKEIFNLIKKAQKNKEIKKSYLTEVVGTTNFSGQTIVSYLQKDDEKSLVKIFSSPVKGSVKIETRITTLNNSSGKTSLLLVEIFGGKTHQIRAQLSSLGFPIVGDGKYGKNSENKKFKAKTQKLTAFKLNFNFSDNKLKYLNNQNFEIVPSWLGK